MATVVINVFEIIDIVDNYFVIISFFKKVLDVKTFNPPGIEAVVDYFSATNFGPY